MEEQQKDEEVMQILLRSLLFIMGLKTHKIHPLTGIQEGHSLRVYGSIGDRFLGVFVTISFEYGRLS